MQLATIALADGTSTAAARATESAPWQRLKATDLSELLNQPEWETSLTQLGDAVTGNIVLPLPAPAKVICCGLNYRNHIVEMGRELPEHPTLFAKYADTLVGPTDDVELAGSTKVDWEAELTVVVGKPLFRATAEEAAAAIAGYTVANDVSARDWQNRTLQWFQGKAWSATTPVGPIMVTADQFDAADGAAITCQVNGKTVQEATLDELVFSPAQLLAYISTFTALRPGDLVLTGTPGGVGAGMKPPTFLNDGDVLTTAIAGIGTLTNSIRIS